MGKAPKRRADVDHFGFGHYPAMPPTPSRSAAVARALVFALLALPGLALALGWANGAFGLQPVRAVERETGEWAGRLLIATLAITPLFRLTAWPPLLSARRWLGVAAAAYALPHAVLFAVDRAFAWGGIAETIVTRPAFTLGFLALLAILPLAATSMDAAVRAMSARRWRKLHRLAYPLAILAIAHAFLQARGDLDEPILLAGVLVWLFVARVPGCADFPAIVAAGWGAAAITALSETLFYWLARGIDPFRLLAAHATFEGGTRPGTVIALAAFAMGIGLALYGKRVARA